MAGSLFIGRDLMRGDDMDGHFHCAHCNQVIHKVKDYLVVEGCMVAYCQAAECQQSMRESVDLFKTYGLRCRQELEWVK